MAKFQVCFWNSQNFKNTYFQTEILEHKSSGSTVIIQFEQWFMGAVELIYSLTCLYLRFFFQVCLLTSFM